MTTTPLPSLFRKDILFPFGFLFLLATSGTLLRSFRDVLFLQSLGYEALPLVFGATTVASVIVATVYIRLARRISPAWIACLFFAFILVCLPIVYWGLSDIPLLHYAFYVLVGLLNNFGVLQFWVLVNRYRDPMALEQDIPLIGSGGLLGGMAGGLLITWLSYFSNAAFLWTALILMPLLIPLGCGIRKEKAKWDLDLEDLDASPSGGLFSHLSTILSERYYLSLASMTLISAGTIVLADFQFKRMVTLQTGDPAEMARIFGILFIAVSAGALIVQWFVLPVLLNRVLPHHLVLFLPVSLLIFSSWIVFSPVLFSAFLLKGSEGVFRHTLDRAGMELFYSPISTDHRHSLKVVMEGALARAGELVAAAILLLFLAVPALADRGTAVLLSVGAFSWISISRQMKHRYSDFLLKWLSAFTSRLSVGVRGHVEEWMSKVGPGNRIDPGRRDELCDLVSAETGLDCQPDWCQRFSALARTYPLDVVVPCYWGWISSRPIARHFTELVLRTLGANPGWLTNRVDQETTAPADLVEQRKAL